MDFAVQVRYVSLAEQVLGALNGGLLLHLFAQCVEIVVEFGERPAVAIFGGVALVKGPPLAVRGGGGVDGPDFAATVADVLSAMKSGFFDVMEVFHIDYRSLNQLCAAFARPFPKM